MVVLGDLVVATNQSRVQDGTYPTGLRLPDLSVVAEEFDVSVQAIRTALTELKLEGVLRSHRDGE